MIGPRHRVLISWTKVTQPNKGKELMQWARKDNSCLAIKGRLFLLAVNLHSVNNMTVLSLCRTVTASFHVSINYLLSTEGKGGIRTALGYCNKLTLDRIRCAKFNENKTGMTIIIQGGNDTEDRYTQGEGGTIQDIPEHLHNDKSADYKHCYVPFLESKAECRRQRTGGWGVDMGGQWKGAWPQIDQGYASNRRPKAIQTTPLRSLTTTYIYYNTIPSFILCQISTFPNTRIIQCNVN